MPDPTPCLQTCRDLYAAITERTTGKQTQSIGHKGRQMAFAETSLKDMIDLYRQLWAQCADAQAELPELSPLGGAGGRRGGPASFVSRHWG